MFITLHADTAGGVVQRNNHSRWSLPRRPARPRWRSMVTALSTTGVDLTRDEYLEFWVFQPASRTADSAGVRLVFDLGKVDEDALAIAPESLTVAGADTVFTGRQSSAWHAGHGAQRDRHLQRPDRRHRHPGRPARRAGRRRRRTRSTTSRSASGC